MRAIVEDAILPRVSVPGAHARPRGALRTQELLHALDGFVRADVLGDDAPQMRIERPLARGDGLVHARQRFLVRDRSRVGELVEVRLADGLAGGTDSDCLRPRWRYEF